MNLKPEEARKLARVLLDDGAIDLSEDSVPGGGNAPSGGLAAGRFGRYRILRLVGAGGMGEVYEAEQESPSRRVAIKVIRADLVSPEVLRRFDYETRVLARLQHPGIAPIYEAGRLALDSSPLPPEPEGSTASGTPYFAMEFVDGKPLTRFAAEGNLSTRARLELFLLVCDAVEHAHRMGIIHRDLKPGNLLVDSTGRPRVMDFGLARATDADIRVTTMHTEIGKLIGTLPYMSPEQVAGDSDSLDTRSDVYSLGVVLYELLGGRLPYSFDTGVRVRIAEAMRAIQESDPAPLSSIDRAFRGDLDTIVAKSLAKERERRYQSVNELAADIRRFLNDEPIVARRAGTWYQVRKFARRNRLASGALVCAILFLLLGVGASTTLAVRERAARKQMQEVAEVASAHEAESARQAAEAQAVTAFITELLASPDPERRGRDVRVLDVMDLWAARLKGSFDDQPEVKARLLSTLAASYTGLGEFGPAEESRRESLELLRTSFGETDPRVYSAMNGLAVVLVARGNLEEAYELYMKAIQGQGTAGEESRQLTAMANLAGLLADKGDLDRAVAMYEEVLRRTALSEGEESRAYSTISHGYAIALMDSQRFHEAEPILRRVAEVRERMLGPDSAGTWQVQSTLAACMKEQGRLAEAIELARQVLAAVQRIHGDDHPATIGALNAMGSMHEDAGELEEAETYHRKALETVERVHPPSHWIIGLMRSNYGRCLRLQGRFDEAEPVLLKAHQELVTALGPENPRSRIGELALVALYTAWGKPEEAGKYRAYIPPGAEIPTPPAPKDPAAP